MGENFANPLAELAEYTDMKRDLMNGYGPIHICGVTDSQKVMSCTSFPRRNHGDWLLRMMKRERRRSLTTSVTSVKIPGYIPQEIYYSIVLIFMEIY